MTNQETMQSTTSIWTKAISLCKNIDELIYVKDKLEVTKKINRRTKAGRELTNKIRREIYNHYMDFQPF